MRVCETKDGRRDGYGRRNGADGIALRALVSVATLLAGVMSFAVPTLSATSASQAGELRREIADPCLGSRWQLTVDPAHPGWPGHLVLVASGEGQRRNGTRIGAAR